MCETKADSAASADATGEGKGADQPRDLCAFDGENGVECELRLCAKIARKVARMKPDTDCSAGEPLDSYRSNWGEALGAIDNYVTVLRERGDARGIQRIRQRVLRCRTPAWFRSCSN